MTRKSLLAALFAFVVADPVLAQVTTEDPNAWQFEVTPYFWAAGINGWTRVGARTPTASIDASFSDVFSNLDFGAMGSFEARKGRWGVIFDSFYVKLSATSEPLAGGRLGTADFGMKEAILQLAGTYRVLDSAVTPVDLVAGVRYAYLSGDLSFSGGPFIPGGASRSDNVSWTDGFVGLRAAYIFSDKWSVIGYADGGAGGTKHSWQFLASANYNFSKSIVGRFGYRIISMDYEKTDFLFNMKTSGIFAGVGIKF
ncbi:hypothetical protein [Caballeronia sp. RCC_10]|uniref:hypothetical protein n=1 Tax=Caballeronia sp. RCC_10 TaxID=3239227 RepID=UPI0035250FDD